MDICAIIRTCMGRARCSLVRTMDGTVYGFGSSQHGELGCGISMSVPCPLKMEYNSLNDTTDPATLDQEHRTRHAAAVAGLGGKKESFGTWGGGASSRAGGAMPPPLQGSAFAPTGLPKSPYSPYSSPNARTSSFPYSSPAGRGQASPARGGSSPGQQPRFGSW